ncbi:hypothetical protein [Qipengyuania sp. MTN3-11]|uniref:hypothetical protein n=1 Tax=Qipengyuania sp. MTN3-11 TaxID=3056557 RepID=UPI0036F41C5D
MSTDIERKIAIIAPHRQALVRRRIRVLDRYGALANPSPQDREEAAAELGLKPAGFLRLHRVWQGMRNPLDLASVGGPRGPVGRRPHEGDDFVRKNIALIADSQPMSSQIASIRALAEEAGVKVRSHVSLAKLIEELRTKGGSPSQDRSGLFLDHVALDIPVLIEGRSGEAAMPIASVLGDASRNCIVHVMLSMEAVDADRVVSILEEANRRGRIISSPAAPRDLHMDVGLGSSWMKLDARLQFAGTVREGRSMRVLRGGGQGGRLVHPQLLEFRARPNAIGKPVEQRLVQVRKSVDEAVPLASARTVVEARLLKVLPRKPAETAIGIERLMAGC